MTTLNWSWNLRMMGRRKPLSDLENTQRVTRIRCESTLSNNNTPGWHKLRITAQGTSAAGVIKSCNTGESVFPEATIREKPSTPVPLVFQGANLRLRNIKIRPINTKPVEKALQELLKRKSSSAAVV